MVAIGFDVRGHFAEKRPDSVNAPAFPTERKERGVRI